MIKLVEIIDNRIAAEEQNEISLGEAVKGMIHNGKDHRPDLKQAVQELLVSQDGGIPLYCKSHDGNASDTLIFKERSPKS